MTELRPYQRRLLRGGRVLFSKGTIMLVDVGNGMTHVDSRVHAARMTATVGEQKFATGMKVTLRELINSAPPPSSIPVVTFDEEHKLPKDR